MIAKHKVETPSRGWLYIFTQRKMIF